jgi:hypothetical protein
MAQNKHGLRAGNEDDSMSDNTKAGFLSAETKKLQSETAKAIGELAEVQGKIAAIIGTDGDAEKQGEKLLPLYIKRDLLQAKVKRDREALFAAVIADAQKSHDAAVTSVEEAKAVKSCLRDVWADSVNGDVKDSNSRAALIRNPRMHPSQLREAATAVTVAQAAVMDAAHRLALLDWPSYEAGRLAGRAVPCQGWEGRSCFWMRAAAIVPELGSMTPERTGTLVFGR